MEDSLCIMHAAKILYPVVFQNDSFDVTYDEIIVANCPETGGTIPKILDMSRSCPEIPLC